MRRGELQQLVIGDQLHFHLAFGFLAEITDDLAMERARVDRTFDVVTNPHLHDIAWLPGDHKLIKPILAPFDRFDGWANVRRQYAAVADRHEIAGASQSAHARMVPAAPTRRAVEKNDVVGAEANQ